MGKNLKEHRECLKNNPNKYTQDLSNDRLVDTFINHIKSEFKHIKFNKSKKLIIKKLIDLIFKTQGNRPIFHIEASELPVCWNQHKNWDLNYIKYEWGHLYSKNQNLLINNIENLGLYSGRCNQHIQSGMDIKEISIYGGILTERINNVLTKRVELFESQEWKQLINELNTI